MRYRSIAIKLWASIFVMVVIVLLTFTAILYDRLEEIYFSHEIEQMKEHNRRWAQILKSGLPDKDIQKNMEFWDSVSFHKITVFDKEGIVRFASDRKHSPLGKKVKGLPIEKSLLDKKGTVVSGYNTVFNMEMTATFLPVTLKSGEKLIIMIHTSNHELMEMNTATKRITITLLIILLVFSAVLAFALSRWLVKPLIAIRKAAIDIAHGDFDNKLDLKRNDELGDLAQTINNLAVRLKRTINNLHNTNQELIEVLKQWKDFLADVSHELRTPLFLISGYTEAIMDEVVDEEKARNEYLPVIHKESLRLQKLVNDLTKVEKSTTLNKQAVDLSELIQETIKPFQILLKERSLNLVIADKIRDLPKVTLDPERFGEVIFNLVDNAIRHTAAGGTIKISAHINKSKELQLEVSDTGAGIPREHLPRLFDRFYRVDKTRGRAQGGTGLGLAIVKKIIDLHGGEISVKSVLKKGTTFTILVPLSVSD